MKKLLNQTSAGGRAVHTADERTAFARARGIAAGRRPIGGLLTRIKEYRFIISCAAVAILSAVVVGSLLKGGESGGAKGPERSASAPAHLAMAQQIAPAEKPAEDPTAEADALPTAEFSLVATRVLPVIDVEEAVPGENAPGEQLSPIKTPEPYYITTEVPVISPKAVQSGSHILVNFGEHNELIPAVQERLMVLWYMDQDEPTDYLGRVTTAAIEVFQRRNDIPVTGKLNARTYNALFSDDAKSYLCTYGDSGSDVEFIQDRLYELGYLKEKTGLFDDDTLKAVKEFQENNDLNVDGRVGRNTKEALYSENANGSALEFGDSGERVLKYQRRLYELGYLTTEPDGKYGPDTRMAVSRFQAQNGLTVDGYLTPSTCAKLDSDDVSGNVLSYAMHGSDVMNVQNRLYELNYLRAKDVNSYYTSITEKAVKLFQRNNGLTVDGKVNKKTMNKLMSSDAVRASSPVSSGGSGNSGGGSGNSGGGSGNSGGGSGNSGGGSGNSGGSNSTVEARINNFLSIARSKLGSRYVRGGKGPSVFDCSGFVYWCMNKAGISQSYMTSYMWRSCKRYQRNNSIYNIKKGDVIVYYGHVAICSGKWTQIDASQSNGKVVERGFNGSYWHRNFICSFRIFT